MPKTPVSKKQLRFRKSVNVMEGLVDQGYEMNWPKASKIAQGMKMGTALRKYTRKERTNGGST
jgi:hypothetical protein